MITKQRKKRHTSLAVPAVMVVLLIVVVLLIARHGSGNGGHEAEASSTLDTEPPVIELVSDPDSYTLPHHAYVEEGYTATDNVDGDLTDQVQSYQGEGKVYYYVEDAAGNSTTAVRTINYDDRSAPEIELTGGEYITIPAGESYTDPGYTATDDGDGDVTDQVTVSGMVNPYALGSYTLTYTVTDSYGNTSTAVRTVTVDDDGSGNYAVVNGRTIYLTFDDGPSEYTEELLDILNQYGVKVTFFTCNLTHTDLIAEEAARGHAVGVHSATHDYAKIYSSVDAYLADFNTQLQVIYDKTGIWTTLFRFPGGSSNTVSKKYCTGIMTALTQLMTEKGYYYFDWNVSSGDAGDTTDTDVVYQNVITGIQSMADAGKDAVVLQHDSKKYSVDAVARIIQWGLENGYSFSSLDESSPTVHQHVSN